MHKSVAQLGFWSSLVVTLLTAVFFVSLAISHQRMTFGSSFLLAPAFVAVMVSIHRAAAPERKVWSQLGLSFAIVYAGMCSLTYYVQLTFIQNNYLPIANPATLPFTFIPGTPIFAQDMLGYAFLCAATVAAGFTMGGGKLQAWIRRLFILNGVLFIVPTLLVPTIPMPVNSAGTGVGDLVGRYANLVWSAYFGIAAGLTAAWFGKEGGVRGLVRPNSSVGRDVA